MPKIAPCSLREANQYVEDYHRHSRASVGHKFSVKLLDDEGGVHGVGIASRPRARALDDGFTLEIIRIATDGLHNGCSMLYGSLRRAAAAMGYTRVVTYIRDDEDGASVRAAGFRYDGNVDGEREWDTPSRRRMPANHERVDRKRYVWP